MFNNVAVKVDKLTKTYRLYNSNLDRVKEALHPLRHKYHHEFKALDDICFEIEKGETVGIIGKNGSGKSTLLKIITGILTPSSGTVTVNGRISALLELGAGFNPELTGVENVYFNGTLMGFSQENIDARLDDILAFADIGEFVYQPVKSYSSGMFVRLAFAIATIIEPDILIVDEALSVGDLFFQQKCYKRLKELKENGVTIIFVTHSMGDIVQYCQQSILLNNNRLEYKGLSSETVKRYLLVQQKERLDVFLKDVSEKNCLQDDSQYDGEQFFWPDASQMVDLSKIDAVSSGFALCSGVAICNEQGVSSKLFTHGEMATIFCEFQNSRPLEVPIGGFMIKNDQNLVVHGKNSLQYDDLLLPEFVPGNRVIRFRFDVKLDLAPGDYTVDVGLATMANKDFAQRTVTPPSQFQSKTLRLCNLSHPISFTVIHKPILDKKYGEIHSGVCNLKGTGSFLVLNSIKNKINTKEVRNKMSTIFHVTHWKAGSQWIKKILREAVPELYVDSKVGVAHFLEEPIRQGMVYPTLYLTRDQFYSVVLPENYSKFIVMRDLRDTLVSAYFSMKISHPILTAYNEKLRNDLNRMDFESGMLFLAENWLQLSANIQRSWLDNEPELIVRYEDLIINDTNLLEEILIERCGLPIEKERLRDIVISNRFEVMTGGRKSGDEDIAAHERKGIAGDWKNYFSDKIRSEFKRLYGQLLIDAGYEVNNGW